MQIKQEAESQPNHTNLTATTKVKNGKNIPIYFKTRQSRTKSATKGDVDFKDIQNLSIRSLHRQKK